MNKKYSNQLEWCIWTQTETNEELIAQVPHGFLSDLKLDNIKEVSPKLEERLAARAALSCLFEEDSKTRWQLAKNQYGQPILNPQTKFHISLSHSFGLAAAIKAPIPCGIDIQAFQEKIFRIQSKFTTPIEAGTHPSLEKLHVIWGAKEAIYKAFGKRGIHFVEEIVLDPFQYESNGGKTLGRLTKNGCTLLFEVHYLRIDQHLLVWVFEIR